MYLNDVKKKKKNTANDKIGVMTQSHRKYRRNNTHTNERSMRRKAHALSVTLCATLPTASSDATMCTSMSAQSLSAASLPAETTSGWLVEGLWPLVSGILGFFVP